MKPLDGANRSEAGLASRLTFDQRRRLLRRICWRRSFHLCPAELKAFGSARQVAPMGRLVGCRPLPTSAQNARNDLRSAPVPASEAFISAARADVHTMLVIDRV